MLVETTTVTVATPSRACKLDPYVLLASAVCELIPVVSVAVATVVLMTMGAAVRVAVAVTEEVHGASGYLAEQKDWAGG